MNLSGIYDVAYIQALKDVEQEVVRRMSWCYQNKLDSRGDGMEMALEIIMKRRFAAPKANRRNFSQTA